MRRNRGTIGRSQVLEAHLAGPDQFVVSEFSQLGSQGEVRVHQERLTTALVEILEG